MGPSPLALTARHPSFDRVPSGCLCGYVDVKTRADALMCRVELKLE